MLKSGGLWALVLGFGVLHLGAAWLLPLSEDEAYYTLWASVPSVGYYDHPPMIAWWIWLGQWLTQGAFWGVRLLPVLASALITLLTWRMAWVISKDRGIAFRAALWQSAMVPFAALGFAATPDAPSILFWVAAIWAVAEVANGRSAHWWLLVGLFAGLGVLSKFTNFFFGLSLVIWLLATREGRGWLRVWQVWAGAAVGVLVLLPFLWWNLRNDWIGFERQFGRVGSGGNVDLGDFALFWLSVVLLVTPLIFWLVLRALRSGRVSGYLIWLTAPIVIYLTWHGLRSLAGGQWIAPIFPVLAVMAALGMPRGWTMRWAAPVGFALALATFAVAFWPGRALIGGHNPSTQIRGWDAVIRDIRTVAAENDAVWIATDAYGLTGQLTHYLAGYDLPVRSVSEPWRYLFLPDIPERFCTAVGLFISRKDFPDGNPYFDHVRKGPDLARREGPSVLMRYQTAVVSGLRGCEISN